MNFAEAALLIQGTSVIYSRKVEYLYALVFQTLAHLTSRQQDGQHRNHHGDHQEDGAAGDGDNDQSDPTSMDAHDIFLNPLPMYDELDEARNITLKAETQRQKSGGAVTKSSTNIQYAWLRGVCYPKFLIFDTVVFIYLSCRASISLMGSLIPDERDHGETFKLLSCNLHASGVLLLDETSKKYLAGYIHGDDDDDGENGQRGFGSAFAPQKLHNPVATLNFDNVADDFFMDGGDDGVRNNDDDQGDDDEHDTGGDVDYGYNDEDYGAADGGAQTDDADAATGKQVSFAAAPTYATRSRHEERDPWAPLDPYDASSATSRPFRKGRSYPKRKKEKVKKSNVHDEDEVLDGLDDPQFKERFFFGAARPQWTSWVWTETKDNALESKFKKKFCKAPVLVKSCDELWKLETKWKSLLRRREAKEEQSAQAMLLQEQAEEEEEQMHAMGMNMVNGTNALDLDLNAANDDDGDDDDDVDDGYDDGGVGYEDGGDWDQGGGDDRFDSAPASRYMDTSGDDIRNDDDPDRPLSYDDICRQHIKTFMQGSEKYVRETNLSKQVNDWQVKLTPILKEQDQHPPFDIHTCGRNIIGHLEQETKVKHEELKIKPKRKAHAISEEAKHEDEENEDEDEVTIPFGEIVGGMSQYQVCRMFLASLQLANNGNVHLVHGQSAAEQSKVPFQMQLLSTGNVYESIQHA